jgi:hypothetical protein
MLVTCTVYFAVCWYGQYFASFILLLYALLFETENDFPLFYAKFILLQIIRSICVIMKSKEFRFLILQTSENIFKFSLAV